MNTCVIMIIARTIDTMRVGRNMYTVYLWMGYIVGCCSIRGRASGVCRGGCGWRWGPIRGIVIISLARPSSLNIQIYINIGIDIYIYI